MNETRTQGGGTIRTSQIANKPRTFRSGPYLDALFTSAANMDERLQSEICARIKQARIEAGFTLQEAADTLGVTLRAWQNYEATRVPFRSLTRIAEITGVSEPWLLRGEAEGADASALAEILRRLEALEEKVDQLPTAAHLKRGLDTLRKAIDAQANLGTRRDRQTGTDG